jgi:hypothetical protein
MTTDKFCFYLQNRLIQTSQTGGQWYNDIPSLVFSGLSVIFNSPAVWETHSRQGTPQLHPPEVNVIKLFFFVNDIWPK